MNNRLKRIRSRQKMNKRLNKIYRKKYDEEQKMNFEEYNKYRNQLQEETKRNCGLDDDQYDMLDSLGVLFNDYALRKRFPTAFNAKDPESLLSILQKKRDEVCPKFLFQKKVKKNEILISELFLTQEIESALQRIQQRTNQSEDEIKSIRENMLNNNGIGIGGVAVPMGDKYLENPKYAQTAIIWLKEDDGYVIITFSDGKKSVKQFHKYWDKYLPELKKKALVLMQENAPTPDQVDFSAPIWKELVAGLKSLTAEQKREIRDSRKKFKIKQSLKLQKVNERLEKKMLNNGNFVEAEYPYLSEEMKNNCPELYKLIKQFRQSNYENN